jgi:hypothetical protein
VLFVENILLSVLPVGEIGSVAAALLDGLVHLEHLGMLLFGLLSPVSIMNGFSLSSQLHLVGVNDFGLLLRVERHLVTLHI